MRSTTRLSLNVPDETDALTGFPAVNQQQMNKLDGAVLYLEGTISARGAASVKGRVYYGTDTHTYYWDTGSVWEVIMLAGPWLNLTSLGSGVSSSGSPPAQARIVGDTAQLRGILTTTATGSAKWASVPSGMAPAQANAFSVNTDLVGNSSGSTHLLIGTDGSITDSQDHYSSSGQFLPLFGLSYPLS